MLVQISAGKGPGEMSACCSKIICGNGKGVPGYSGNLHLKGGQGGVALFPFILVETGDGCVILEGTVLWDM